MRSKCLLRGSAARFHEASPPGFGKLTGDAASAAAPAAASSHASGRPSPPAHSDPSATVAAVCAVQTLQSRPGTAASDSAGHRSGSDMRFQVDSRPRAAFDSRPSSRLTVWSTQEIASFGCDLGIQLFSPSTSKREDANQGKRTAAHSEPCIRISSQTFKTRLSKLQDFFLRSLPYIY